MKTKHIQLMLALAAILFCSTPALAQLHFGVRNGVALTTLSAKGDLYNDDNLTFSYTAGAFATIPVVKYLAVQPEINYFRKGRSNETNELATVIKTDYLLHYLQVPVLLQYRNSEMFQKEGSALFINAGPYASFLLSNKTRVNGDSEATAVEVKESSKTDWGLSMGIGCMFPVVKQKICIDLRYDMGLAELEYQPTDYRTKSLSLTAGISF